MLTLYICFLAGGAVLPLISFFISFMDGGVDTDVSADIGTDVDTDIDVGDMDPSLEVNADISADIDTVDPGLNIGSDMDSILTLGLLPTSLMALSSLAIAFGAVGAIMTSTGKGSLITLIVALLAGYLTSVVVQTLIKTLKKVQTRSYGIDENELLLYDGKIIDTILPGQLGTVSFTTLKGVLVSYPARCADTNSKLETGRIVKALEFKEGIFIVEPKNKYE